MTARTYQQAYTHARALAQAGDRIGAGKLLARLLWHVEAADGGFIGLDDWALARMVAADPRLNMADVTAAQWAPGEWPRRAAETAVAA